MRGTDLTSKKRPWGRWTLYGAAGLLALTLAGCGGGGGGGTTATTGGTTGGTSAAVTTIPTAAALAANDTATNPTAAFTAVQNAGIAPVVVNSPPKVNFTVFSGGAVVKGLTASNVSAIIAKLVPGTNGSADQWVSYTYRTETATSTVGPSGAPVLASATQATTDAKQTDAALLAQQVAYNDAGYYTYTFKTDIKDTAQTNGVTFEPNLTHRVALQLSYTDSTGTTVRVNPYFDFTIDASGNAVAVTDTSKTRKVVDITTCNECHDKLALHGGGRVDTQYCAMCHNRSTTDANSGNGLDLGIMVHKIHAGEHLTEWFGTSYAIWGYRDSKHDYSEVTYPQLLQNCQKCHSGDKKDSAGKQLAAQGDNWKNKPTRDVCGSCHAGINFATGKGVTIADAEAGLTTSTYGHVGGAQADDKSCALCHGAAAMAVYHVPVTPPAASILASNVASGHTNAASIAAIHDNLPAGAIKVTYDVKSVSRNASKQPVMVFRILQNGARKDFNANTGAELWDNFIGSPSAYFAFAVPQDGITAPADFNASVSSEVKTLWKGTGTGTKAGTLTGPDGEGYYTATLTGAVVPDNAVMLTGGLGYTYSLPATPPLTQTNVADYAYNATTGIGGLIVQAPNVNKVATGYTGRRAIVETARCNNCHEQLNVFTTAAFHAGQRNDAQTCSWCHTPNRVNSGWSVDSGNFIHAIHAASKRSKDFTYYAPSTTKSFADITYPGILKNCETCHAAGTYDFSASASSSALSNRLYKTVGTGIYNGTAGTVTTGTVTASNPAGTTQSALGVFRLSPYVTADNATNYGSGFSFNAATGASTAAAGSTLVNSPIANSCFSCHDSDLAIQHMKQNGGSLYAARTTALATSETCMLCHASGKVADIKTMHAR